MYSEQIDAPVCQVVYYNRATSATSMFVGVDGAKRLGYDWFRNHGINAVRKSIPARGVKSEAVLIAQYSRCNSYQDVVDPFEDARCVIEPADCLDRTQSYENERVTRCVPGMPTIIEVFRCESLYHLVGQGRSAQDPGKPKCNNSSPDCLVNEGNRFLTKRVSTLSSRSRVSLGSGLQA